MNLGNQKGSMTIEASIIMPIILLCVIAILLLPVFLFKQVYLRCTTNQAAGRGYVVWKNISGDIETGIVLKEQFTQDELYRRFYDSQRESRLGKVEDYTKLKTGNGMEFLKNKEDTKVSFIDYIVFKKLEVSVKETCANPLGNLLWIFGMKKEFAINSKSNAIINDAAEFIRNTDFILDLKRELEDEYPQLKNLGSKVLETIEDIKEKIKETIE